MKVSFKKLFICIASVVVLIIISCDREDTDFLGPAVVYAPEGFTVDTFTVSNSTIDFTTDSMVFNAQFSDVVTWVLTIKGEKSGAVREIKGLSAGLNDVVWKGGHDYVNFFREGEKVTATLSFFGTKTSEATTAQIVKAINFSTYGTAFTDGGFENASKITFPNWAKFNVTEQGVDSMAISYNGKIVPPVQGTKYFYIKGLGEQPVFVDGVQYIGKIQPKLPKDANNVWFNIYFYGTGDPNVEINVELQESDFDGFPGYQGKDDDAFVFRAVLNHVGWKLFSFKYGDLLPSANADFGGSGNNIHEPDRLVSWDVILLKKSNPDSPVEVYFDFPIITVGDPFNPSK